MKKFILVTVFFVSACVSVGPVAAPTPALMTKSIPEITVDNGAGAPVVQMIEDLAGKSSCAKYSWKDRGTAKSAYFKGIALVFAKAVCEPKRDDVVIASAARKLPESTSDITDALSWYKSNFQALGMTNDVGGTDTLRHAFTLLLGLGMRESSGEYCCGRDMSASFDSADSAESGLFQASWGAKRASPVLPKMFDKYKTDQGGCMLDVFKDGVTCSAGNNINWGTGNGKDWQALTKTCPAFSAEYAAVLLRTLGGTKGEFGPLRKKEAEIRPECDAMLKQVQDLVLTNLNVCDSL